MTPERWTRIDELFHSALDRDANGRAAFLAEACGGDSSLRREIESLLAAHQSLGDFLENDPRAEAPPLAPGQRLGPYEILALLGSGGMGQVYRARDARLLREVAIKVVARAAPGAPGPRRLVEEARAAAALSHPNIVPVHDVGEHGGIFFVVCELLEGETLRARLSCGPPLPASRCLELARELARGLRAAHDKGIVHRDIKPENLFLTSGGPLKILDFGLAKRLPPGPWAAGPGSLSVPGMILGTAGYMSPEQVCGEPVDARSDVFSFGVVLYEMLSGRRAFGGSPIEAMHATLHAAPPALPGEVPAALAALVARCLERDAGARFPSARELCQALEAIALDPAEPARAAIRTADGHRSVAVLPFRELGGAPGSEHLGLGLADATITELSQLGSLLVRSTSAILRYQTQPVDPQQAGRELSVDAVVDASFQRSGSQLRINVRLISTADGSALWARKIDASLDDVFRMQDEVSRSIATALELELTSSEERRLAQRVHAPPPAGRAYELYLRGRAHLLRETFEDYRSALDWFEKAIAAEPTFAAAWAGAAETCARIAFFIQAEGDWYRRAVEKCERALALDPHLPEGHYLRAFLAWSSQGGFDHALAIRECLTAIAGRPGLDDAYMRLGTVLHHVGLIDEGIVEWERGLAISPDHDVTRLMVGYGRHHQGRYREALEISEAIASRAPSSWIHYLVAQCQLRLGRPEEARATVELMLRQVPGDLLAPPILGLVAALRGDAAGAREQIALIASGRSDLSYAHHAWYDAACIQALLGDADEAMRWLARAAHGGYPCHPFFATDPWLASLRSDARYRRLLTELREECAGYERLYRELRDRAAAAPPPALRSPGSYRRRVALVGLLASAAALLSYAVLRKPLAETPVAAARAYAPSIAVLPLQNLGSDKEQEYFSDGLAEELINLLAKVPGLKVAARTSAFSFKGSGADARAIGEKLRVSTVLEGSVRKSGDRIRVSAQLVSAADGYQLWSETYDRKLTDVFALQDEIAQSVVAVLKLKLLKQPTSLDRRTASTEAYNQYLLGRQFFNRGNTDDYRRAMQAYEKSVALDPGYAPAWAGLAMATFWVADSSESAAAVKSGQDRAVAAADKAVALGPDLPDGYRARAFVRLPIQWDWSGAKADFDKALAINPDDSEALQWSAQTVLRALERLPEAVAASRKAVELDPLNARAWTVLASSLYLSGQHGPAREANARSLEISPAQSVTLYNLAVIFIQDGQPAAALEASQRSVGEMYRLMGAALAQHDLGRPAEAKRALDQLISRWGHAFAYQIAQNYSWRGDKDGAFHWLERAIAQRDGGLVNLQVDPLLAGLRGDPRYAVLLRKLNLPPR